MNHSEEEKLNINDVILLARFDHGLNYTREQIDEIVYEKIFPQPDKIEATMSINGETSRHTFHTWRKSVVVEYFRETARALNRDLMLLSDHEIYR